MVVAIGTIYDSIKIDRLVFLLADFPIVQILNFGGIFFIDQLIPPAVQNGTIKS
jgi:hypothetical protein